MLEEVSDEDQAAGAVGAFRNDSTIRHSRWI